MPFTRVKLHLLSPKCFSFSRRSFLILAILSLCFYGISSFAADTTEDNIKWLAKQLETASSFQRGSSVNHLLELFRRDTGYGFAVTPENLRANAKPGAWPYAATFSMRSCPLIKMDVRFQSGKLEGEPGDLIEWVSKPYLQKNTLE
jgi:hypothetical protein